jgi:hypothetical protein
VARLGRAAPCGSSFLDLVGWLVGWFAWGWMEDWVMGKVVMGWGCVFRVGEVDGWMVWYGM